MTPLPSSVDDRVYSFVRAVVFLAWALILVLDPLERLADFPVASFEPPGLLSLLPREVIAALWTPGTLLGLRLIGAALCLAAAAERLSLVVAPAACIVVYLYQTVVRGFGYVNHSEIQLLLAASLLAAFALADRIAADRSPASLAERRAFPFAAVAILIAFTYFGSGLNRLISFGPSGILDGSLALYMIEVSAWDSIYPFELASAALQWIPMPLVNMSFLAVTLVEISAPACLFSRRARNLILPALVAFHLSTFLLMKIIFIEQLLLLALFWTDLPARLVHRRV